MLLLQGRLASEAGGSQEGPERDGRALLTSIVAPPQEEDASSVSRPSLKGSAIQRYGPVAGLLAAALFVSLSVWPGNMDADALNQIAQARSGQFVDWWTPVLDWMWRLLFLLHLSPGFVLLTSTTIFVLSVFEILRCVLGRWAAAGATILITAFPPVLGFLCSLSRDTWFGALNLAAYALAVRCVRRPESNVTLLAVLSLAAVWFGMAARQNAVIALTPVVALDLYLLWSRRSSRGSHARNFERRKRWVIIPATLATVVLFAVSQYVLTYDVIGASRTYVQQQLFQGDLAELSVRTHQVLEPRFIFPAQNLKALATHTSPYTALPLLEGPGHPLVRTRHAAPFPSLVNGLEDTTLEHDWLDAIRAHPGSYVLERWQLWTHLIGWTAPVYEPYHPGIDQNPWGYRATFGPMDRAVMWYLSRFESGNLNGGPLFRIWPYLLIGVVVTADLVRRRRRATLRIVGCMCGATLVYYLGYMVLAMGNGFRWAWPTVTAVVVALVVDVVDRVSTLRAPVAHEVTGADQRPQEAESPEGAVS